MQRIKIAGVTGEVNDYSPLVQRILAIKLEEVVEYVKSHCGHFRYPRIDSSVGKDSFHFSIRKDLNDVFGLDYHHPDAANDIQHYFNMWAEFEIGKGKKNVGKNTLIVRTDVSVPRPPDRYETQKNPYYVLFPKFEKGHVVEFKQGFSTEEFLEDPLKLAKQLETAFDTTIQVAKDAWVTLHDEQTSRDIDLMEVPDIITSAFAKHGIPVKCEFKNSLTYTAIDVETEYMADHVGFMTLHYTDKGRWEFEQARGEFEFISNLYDICNSKYDRKKKDIRPEKFSELMEFIADQYLIQVKAKLDFAAKLNDYMICWTKED